jgi:NADH/NAD ratio-sensing transcriptional regulator Rex
MLFGRPQSKPESRASYAAINHVPMGSCLHFPVQTRVVERLQRCGVEEILNHKVSETFEVDAAQKRKVKKVLDSKVSTTEGNIGSKGRLVEEVLNHKVDTTT